MDAVRLTWLSRHKHGWLPLLSLAVLVAAFSVLHHLLAGYHLRGVMLELRSIPFAAVWWAALAAVASYLVLSGYDLLALRYVQQPVSVGRGVLTAFVAFAVGHNVGFATLSGAAVRLRLYGAVGVSAAQVALISAFCAWTTVLGATALVAYALYAEPQEAALMLHLSTTWVLALATLLVLALLAYLWWVSVHRRAFTWREWSVQWPTWQLTLGQIIVAALDLCLAAACLYALLPATVVVSYSAFLAAYVLTIVAVLVSAVPAGLGVLEAVMALALPQVPITTLLAALLMYRVIYYLAPLSVAACALATHEAWLQRRWVLKLAGMARDWLSAVAPLVLSAGVLLAGTALLLSGATPGITSRLQLLNQILPLPVLELSHLLGSVVGLGLLILSRALFRRVQAAWPLTLLLLLSGAVLSLLKGLDYEPAIFLTLLATALYGARSAFYRHAALSEPSFNPRWLLGFTMVVGVVIWVGLFAYRHVDYSNELWWTFALDAGAPRMLRASLVVSVLLAAWILYSALRPGTKLPALATAQELLDAQPIVAQAAQAAANLALLPDKRLLFHPERHGLLMYQVIGRSWVAMGDPVVATNASQANVSQASVSQTSVSQTSEAQRDCAYELAWSFRELSDAQGGWTVFYQVRPEFLSLYVDLGLALLKLGEEARVYLPDFSLAGSHRAEFRTARRKAERNGVSFEVLPAPVSPQVMQELARVSQDWLAAKSAHEKQFSVGYFSPAYLQHFPIAVVRYQGRIVAFANLWPTARQELAVDLMRYAADALSGVMDYLFVEVMLWVKRRGMSGLVWVWRRYPVWSSIR